MKHFFMPCILALIVCNLACEKIQDVGTVLHIKLTDAPYDADEVNVEIQGVKVRFKGDAGSTNGDDWVWLDTRHGIYNLLDLQNGITTDLATGSIPNGKVKEIRMILGKNNSIRTGSKVYPLRLPPDNGAGYLVAVDRKLATPTDYLTIDFDAGLSVSKTASGDFNLTPNIKVLK